MRLARHHVDLCWKALQTLGAGVALGAVAFTFAVAVPIYIRNYRFEQVVREEARRVVANPVSAPSIQGDLYQKARDLGVPVDIQQIRVDAGEVVPSSGTIDTVMTASTSDTKASVGIVDIEVSYAVPVQFPGYTFELRFHVHADDHSV